VGRYLEEHQLQRPDDELVAAVVADVVDLLALEDPEPVETHLVRWGGGLPQYLVGHVDRVAAVRAAVAEVPGLAVAGAAYDGVGVPACIAGARRAVATLT
jgi:oxygen-dependent protoporphyrinogen oxidase